MISEEEKLLEARIADLFELSDKHYAPKFTMFLDERQTAMVEDMIHRSYPLECFRLWGGYDGAVRTVLSCFPDGAEPDSSEFPIQAVSFRFRQGLQIGHRDVLGSLMALELKREAIGDILIEDQEAIVFLYRSVVPMVLEEIRKIGSVGVKPEIAEGREFFRTEKFEEISGTAASLRLDCILSLALRQSREKTTQLIKSVGVDLNYHRETSPSKEMKEADKFSVRGYGKFILSEVGGNSKKNRIFVRIKKYM